MADVETENLKATIVGLRKEANSVAKDVTSAYSELETANKEKCAALAILNSAKIDLDNTVLLHKSEKKSIEEKISALRKEEFNLKIDNEEFEKLFNYDKREKLKELGKLNDWILKAQQEE